MASIKYLYGNILLDKADVLVCPTNAVGVMGAGLAKRFREQIQGLFAKYRNHCRNNNPNDMVPFAFHQADKSIVYCFHTKRHWRESSSKRIVETGMRKLVAWCKENNIKSIAIPPLGCGKGNLLFEDEVKPIIERLLVDVELDVHLYCQDE